MAPINQALIVAIGSDPSYSNSSRKRKEKKKSFVLYRCRIEARTDPFSPEKKITTITTAAAV